MNITCQNQVGFEGVKYADVIKAQVAIWGSWFLQESARVRWCCQNWQIRRRNSRCLMEQQQSTWTSNHRCESVWNWLPPSLLCSSLGLRWRRHWSASSHPTTYSPILRTWSNGSPPRPWGFDSDHFKMGAESFITNYEWPCMNPISAPLTHPIDLAVLYRSLIVGR